jgi:small subunit ribosomal protein S18
MNPVFADRLNPRRVFYPGMFYEPDELNPETSRRRFTGSGKRRLVCLLSQPGAPEIDFKNTRLLTRFVSDSGKIMPRRLTGTTAKKQRELSTAIKRSRILGLMPFTSKLQESSGRGPRK